MSGIVILDTSIFIDHLRTGCYRQRLITSNRSDFELINHYRKIQLEIW